MKTTFFFCSVLALAASKPGGYYHQEYNYKTSSSSFKNNELQHKNENEGFYSKDGDLDGIVKPKVKSHSQKSEYVNPRLLSGTSNYQGGYSSGSNANYLASSDRLFANSLSNHQAGGAIDGYASSDRVLDLSNVYNSANRGSFQENLGSSGYRGSYGTTLGNYETSQGGNYGSSIGGSSSYGYSHGGTSYGQSNRGTTHGALVSGSYGTNSDLTALLQRLQSDMTRQLESAISDQYRSSGYTTSVTNSQMSADVRTLEDELKRNLTRQLEESLRSQYGHQESIGSNSYSISSGRPSTIVNYNNQELAELRRQVEDNLMKKLHQGVRTTYNTESMSSYASSNNYLTPTRPRSNYDNPILITPTNYQYTRYTPISNPESITQIASRIQSNINLNLDDALHNIYSKYLSNTNDRSYYTISDFDNEVNRIKDDIVRNLTTKMDEQIRTNYGQVLKGEYYYSVSTNGDTSTQSNYNIKDLDNLRRQVEENLVKKLNDTIRTYREQYQRRQTYNVNTNYYTATSRPAYYTSGGQTYDYSDLQRQLSQQLQNALSKHDYGSYSSSSSYNPQAFQTSFDELSRELQRNLTEQLNNYKHTSSSYGYSSGTSGSNAEFETMKNQLQNQLMKQLQQGLKKQYQFSASASYSASSSSSSNSNYGSGMSYPTHSNYMECCGGRRKRDISYGRYRDDFMPEIPQEVENQEQQLVEQTENDLNQQLELEDPKRLRFTDQELTGQQLEDDFSQKLQLSNGQRKQNFENEDQQLTQQVDDDYSQNLQLSGSQKKKNLEIDDQHLTQQLEDDFSQQLQLSTGQEKINHANEDQQITQQLEDDFSQQLQLSGSQKKPNLENDPHHLTQQLEDDFSEQLQLSGDQKKKNLKNEDHQLTQQLEDDLTQQLELTNQIREKDEQLQDISQNLELTNPKSKATDPNELEQQELEIPKPKNAYILGHKPKTFGQEFESNQVPEKPEQHSLINQEQVEDSGQRLQRLEDQFTGQIDQNNDDLTQQLEIENPQKLKKHIKDDDSTQQLELGPQKLEQIDDQLTEQDFTQQTEDEITQKLQFGSHPKRQPINQQQLQTDEDLTQQLELVDQKFKPNQQLIGQQFQDQDEDLHQQLEFNTHKPRVINQQEQEINQQIIGQQFQEQDDLTQQLELSNSKLTDQQSQDQDDFTQQLGTTNHKQLGQQLQEQDDLTQQLELSNSQNPKLEIQQVVDQQLQEKDDLTQQLELSSDQKPILVKELVGQQLEQELTQQLELETYKPNGKLQEQETRQELDNTVQQLELTNGGKHKSFGQEQEIEGLEQKLGTTSHKFEAQIGVNQRPNVKKLEEDAQQLETGQQLEDENNVAIQKLEIDNTKKLKIEDSNKNFQYVHEQQLNGGLEEQQLQEKDKKQIEDDFTNLEIGQKRKQPDYTIQPVEDVNLESELSTDDISVDDVNKTKQVQQELDENTRESTYQHRYSGQKTINHVTQHNVNSFEGYGSPALHGNVHYTHSGERTFTNAHSGFMNHDQFSGNDNYQQALRQQNALLDLLKQKIQTQAVNQDSFGQRTIKKTVYENSVPVSSLEGKQIMNPNEFRQNGESTFGRVDSIEQSRGTHGSFGYTGMGTSGRNFHQTNYFEPTSMTYNAPFQHSQFTGQTTRRIVHYVNGKPVSAVEKIQVIKPNGQIVQSEHNLPLNGHLIQPYSHRYNSNQNLGQFEGFQPHIIHKMSGEQQSISGSFEGYQANEADILRRNHRYGLGVKQYRGY